MSKLSTHRYKLVAIATALAASSVAQAAPVFTENFEGYADTAALQASWTTVAAGLTLNNTGFDPTPTALATVPQSTVTNLGRFNAVQFASRDFTPQAAGQSWTATADVIFEGYARSLAFGLTDSSGQGYIVRWNGANPNQNTGRGAVIIYEHGATPVASGSDYGTAFTNMIRPGYAADASGVPNESDPTPYTTSNSPNMYHPVTGYRVTSATGTDQNTQTTYDSTFRGLMTLSLSFDAATGTLKVFNNGSDNPRPDIPVAEIADATPLTGVSFSRIYLLGQNSNFDNISVEFTAVPEPAASTLLALPALALMRRRK